MKLRKLLYNIKTDNQKENIQKIQFLFDNLNNIYYNIITLHKRSIYLFTFHTMTIWLNFKYIPRDCTEIITTPYITFYHTPENSLKHIVIAYEPKATKNHSFFEQHPTHERLLKRINDTIERRKANAEYRETQKQLDRDYDAKKDYNQWDIIYNSWGWEQTNIDFFQIVKVTKQQVQLRQISQHTVDYVSSMAEHVAPNPDCFTSEEITKHKVSRGGYIKFKFGSWNRYDGNPKYQSHYA